jgi:hypothetical protein
VALFIQAETRSTSGNVACSSTPNTTRYIAWLQGIALAWMLAECGVSLYGAISAHSPALLTFGVDSFVELLSATVVLLAIAPSFPLTKDRAARLTGILLFCPRRSSRARDAFCASLSRQARSQL